MYGLWSVCLDKPGRMLSAESIPILLVFIRTVPVTDSGKRTQFSCTTYMIPLIEVLVKRRSKIRAEKGIVGKMPALFSLRSTAVAIRESVQLAIELYSRRCMAVGGPCLNVSGSLHSWREGLADDTSLFEELEKVKLPLLPLKKAPEHTLVRHNFLPNMRGNYIYS